MKLESISDIKKNISNQPTAGLMNDEYKCFQRLSLYACFVVVGFAGIRFAIIVKSNLRSSTADKKKKQGKDFRNVIGIQIKEIQMLLVLQVRHSRLFMFFLSPFLSFHFETLSLKCAKRLPFLLK
jgi:hypothetical protein